MPASTSEGTSDSESHLSNDGANKQNAPTQGDSATNHDIQSSDTNNASTSPAEKVIESQDSDGNAGGYYKKFQVHWRKLYPWLRYSGGKMYCQVCLDGKLSNSFTVGTDNLRTSTLTRHVSSESHKRGINAPLMQNHMEMATKKALDSSEKAVQIAMQCVYWLVKEKLPLSKYASLLDLLKSLGVPNIEALKHSDTINYSSEKSANGFLEIISDIIDAKLTARVQQSPVITVITDESTDIVVNHRLAINIRIVNPTTLKPSTHFLTDVKLVEGTGEAIFKAVSKELSQRNIPLQKVYGLGTDGAAVMTGKKKGLTGRFLEVNPHIANGHCSAHRVALVSEQAAEKTPKIKEYREALTSLYYYFYKSPTKASQMAEVQKVLEEPILKYREIH